MFVHALGYNPDAHLQRWPSWRSVTIFWCLASAWELAAKRFEESSHEWQAASWELGFASRELPGCSCTGPWEEFRKLLNWTLTHHALYRAEPFAPSKAAGKLCTLHGVPLVHSSLGEDLLKAVHDDERLRTHACPAGLVAALSLCAAVHAATSGSNGAETIEDRDPPTEDTNGSTPHSVLNWGLAFQTWPTRLPMDCALRLNCLAYVEAFLAVMVIPYAAHCLEHSLWPVDANEVTRNAMAWISWLFTAPSVRSPPQWQELQPSRRLKRRCDISATGVFVGPGRSEFYDASGVSWLVSSLAKWRLQSAETRNTGNTSTIGGDSLTSIAKRHFAKIFGPLLHPWDIGARGPLAFRMQVHKDDFAGPRANLRFFIYDLPGAVHSEILAALHGRIREAASSPSNCDFGLSPCTELSNEGGAFSGYRPYAAEVTFLAKLLAAPEGVIVDDHREATFYVVPFFSSTWCFLGAPHCWVRCGGMRPLNALLPLLQHYNVSTAHRHLFLASDSTGDLPVDLQMQPLVLSYGPNPCGQGSGPVLMPPPVTDELPLLHTQDFASKDLLLFVADGIGHRPFRQEAIAELQIWQRRLPHMLLVSRRDANGRVASTSSAMLALQMRRAVFCPVLPGDNTFRMRLFHAVLAGCIPVVVAFPGGSWYRRYGPPVELSLPFADRGVDWHGLAVELPHDPKKESFAAWAKRLVPSLLKLGIDEVQTRQNRLVTAMPLLRYDFHGSRPDAFTMLLNELESRASSTVALGMLECFDPRLRFGTHRSISGVPQVEREELEVFGFAACCPVPSRRGAERCDVGVNGRCVRFRFTEDSHTDVGAPNVEEGVAADSKWKGAQQEGLNQGHEQLRAHMRAMFAGRRFDDMLPEDRVCGF